MIFLSKSFILVGGRSSSIWACWHWKYPVERKEISGGRPSPTRELKRVRWFNISWKGKTAFVHCVLADICSWLNIHQCRNHLCPKRMDEGLRGEEVTRELEKKCLDQPAWDELRCQSSLFYVWVGKNIVWRKNGTENAFQNTGILCFCENICNRSEIFLGVCFIKMSSWNPSRGILLRQLQKLQNKADSTLGSALNFANTTWHQWREVKQVSPSLSTS